MLKKPTVIFLKGLLDTPISKCGNHVQTYQQPSLERQLHPGYNDLRNANNGSTATNKTHFQNIKRREFIL